jgi:hypothetical protein
MKIQMFKVTVCENKAFMHVAKKGDVFFIYVFPIVDVRSHQHEIIFQYKNTNICLKKKMLTPSWNIDHVYKIKNSNAMNIDGKSLMWISLAMVKNKQERNWVVIEWKAWRWTKTNKGLQKGSPLWVPMVMANGMILSWPFWLWWL